MKVLPILFLLGLFLDAQEEPGTKEKSAPPPPTLANVAYGTHERQVLDFWKAESTSPAPVLFYIHGGAWLNGDKSKVTDVPKFLAAGISVVSINYRYIPMCQDLTPPVKGPMGDAARALQFVRSKAVEWNLDKQRIGLCGGSAGACTSLWLVFHKDLADPGSADPVSRESTRPWCAAVNVPQTSLDPAQMKEWTPNSKYGAHAFFKTGTIKNFDQFLARRDEILPFIAEYSPWALVSAGAPPIYMAYPGAPAIGQDQKDPTHTANFGLKMKERCDALSVPCDFYYRGVKDVSETTTTEYLLKELKAPRP